jgi:intracellular septation protein A
MTDAVAPLPGGNMGLPPISVKAILFESGPRFARDSFGPIAAFWVLWKLWGLVPGILAATTLAVAAYLYERRRERPGLVVRISLVFVLVQAVVGLASGSAEIYLAIPVFTNAGYGLAFIGSTLIGRPLAAVYAEELFPLPDEVKASHTHKAVFRRITLTWGTYMLARSALRLFILVTFGVDVFVAVSFATGSPITASLMAWSVWYGVRSFRRSTEWGPAIAALEEAALEAEFDVDVPPEVGSAPQS